MEREKRPTIRDVARLAGVSAQTVSRVLNTPEAVREPTRERVLQGIAQLGYRPSLVARGLSRARSGAIGIVDSGSDVVGQILLLSAMESAARELGFSPRLVTTRSDSRGSLKRALEVLHDEQVEGIVVMGNTRLDVRGAAWAAHKTPVVLVASDGSTQERMSTISVNQAHGTGQLLEHLAAFGPRVGHITVPTGWVDADVRRAEWNRQYGREYPELLETGDWTAASGYAAMHRLLDKGVDAVFASNDYMALGALRACHERGLVVPHDVGVAGFDDIPGADFFSPPLTTVQQPFAALGRRAAALLVEMIGGGPASSEQLVARLVVRASSDPRSRQLSQ